MGSEILIIGFILHSTLHMTQAYHEPAASVTISCYEPVHHTTPCYPNYQNPLSNYIPINTVCQQSCYPGTSDNIPHPVYRGDDNKCPDQSRHSCQNTCIPSTHNHGGQTAVVNPCCHGTNGHVGDTGGISGVDSGDSVLMPHQISYSKVIDGGDLVSYTYNVPHGPVVDKKCPTCGCPNAGGHY